MKYFYTYRLPFKPNIKFDYWKVKDADECLGRAFSKYRTTNFYIGSTTKSSYDEAMGIKKMPKDPIKTRILYMTEAQVETLKNLIGDPTKFENLTNKEFVKLGLKDIMEQLNEG